MKKQNLFSEEEFLALRGFVKNEIAPFTKVNDEKEVFPLAIYQKLHQMGWSNCMIPTELGGIGASSVDMVRAFREIAYGSPGIAFTIAANAAAVVAILIAGRKELAQEFATDYQNRFSLSSFCFTEPDHGSDVLRIETYATRVEGGFRLNGKKCFITNANYADRLLVVAKTNLSGAPKNSMSLFLIDQGTPGLTIGQDYHKLGIREASTSEIFLDNVLVPSDRMVGNEGEGFAIAGRSIQRSRIMMAAIAIGLCDRVRDLATDHLKHRVLYEKPLLTQPAISNLLAQLHAEKEGAWALINNAAEAWDSGNPSFLPSSMAKLLAGQIATKYSSHGVELFGGYGYMKEYEIEKLYRDAKFFEIVEGPNFVQLAIMAKELFPMPAKTPVKVAA